MKFDPILGGIFKHGEFTPIFEKPIEPDLSIGLNDKTLAIINSIQTSSHENLCTNIICMPDFITNEKITSLNIFLLYRESYLSIAFGNYNAGLLGLSQLMEVLLKEIIYVKVGTRLNSKTYGEAIRFAQYNILIDFNDIQFFRRFLSDVRNSYIHYKILKIIPPNFQIPAWTVKAPTDPSKINEFMLELASLTTQIKKGQIKPTFIDPLKIPSVAAIIKEDIDRKKAISWLWQISLKLEQFFDIYLTSKNYEALKYKN